MTDKVYRIRPLEWTNAKDHDGQRCRTEFGLLEVFQCGSEFVWSTVFEGTESGFSFEKGRADTIELAKAAAEAHWRERVERCLVEVNP